MGRKTKAPGAVQKAGRTLGLALGGVLFFFLVCLCAPSTVRAMALLLTMLTLSAAFLFWERLRERITPPVLALALMVLMDGISCAYAVSGKFALDQMLKIVSAFCIAMILLALIRSDRPERVLMIILEGFAAVAGLVSIDYMSTRLISTPVLTALSWFSSDFVNLPAVETGVRMIPILIYPNTFATCMGVGVLLSLSLTSSEEKPAARIPHLICLAISALAFVLVFSMGASLMIVPAFLVLLALTGKELRISMLILMVETLAVTVLSAFPIARTSMTVWMGFRPVPLLCALGGVAALCALDLLAGRRLAEKLKNHGKAVLVFIAVLLAGAGVFFAAALNLTTGVTLQAGEPLRRSAYPALGSYTVEAETDGDPIVVIQSQDRAEAMMHTNTELYRGPLSRAAFTVPEGSLVVWFQFSANSEIRLEAVTYRGESGSGSVPLGYRLLPGFIANRIQGLRANQNAIQRFAFFEDGLKLFLRSPVIGLGLGAYGNAANSVQSFFYYTYYTHNHLIQTMAEQGIIGLLVFLVLLGVSAVSIWRGRKKPMAPALGAALVFLSCHSCLDGVFSYFATLPMVYCVFAAIGLCCGNDFPMPAWAARKTVRGGLTLGICALLVLFGVLLGCNVAAYNLVTDASDLEQLERAASLDPFEKADYMLTYVVQVTGTDPGEVIRQKADDYARRLGRISSNIIPFYLTEYYLDSGRTELGFEMAERYVEYVSADSVVWDDTFALLERYEQDTDVYRAGVLRIAELLDTWNEEHMGHVELNERSKAFIARTRG